MNSYLLFYCGILEYPYILVYTEYTIEPGEYNNREWEKDLKTFNAQTPYFQCQWHFKVFDNSINWLLTSKVRAFSYKDIRKAPNLGFSLGLNTLAFRPGPLFPFFDSLNF